MSPTDLDPIDERGRAAAADLRARAGSRPRPVFDPEAAALVAPTPIAARRSGWHDPRRLAVAAAVVLVLVGCAIWAGMGADDDGPADVTTTTTEVRPFRPTELPAGFELSYAADVAVDEVAPGSLGGPLVLYGPSGDDPRLGLSWISEENAELDEGEAVGEVDGRTVRRLETSGMLNPTVAVADPDGGWLLATSPELSEEDLVAVVGAASATDGRATVPDDALPDGWSELGTSQTGLLGPSSVAAMRGAPSVALRSMLYAGPDEGDLPTSITVTSSGGDQLALDAALVTSPSVEEVTVRGHRALLVSLDSEALTDEEGIVTPASFTVSWLESPGELVSVSGFSVDRDELLRAAESVEPVADAEWERLVEQTRLGDLGGLVDQGEEIARGDFADGTAWVLYDLGATADEGDGGPGGAVEPQLSLHTTLATGSGSMTTSMGMATSGDGDGAPLRSLAIDQVAGRQLAYGWTVADAVEVRALGADGTVLDETGTSPLPDAAVGSWFVLELPAGTTELELVDAGGTVLGATLLSDVVGGEPSVEVEPGTVETTIVDPSGGPDGGATPTTVPS